MNMNAGTSFINLRNTFVKALAAAAVLALASAPFVTAGAQEEIWVPEIPLTRDTGTNARALGMGGACLALSDDCAALRYNPAGLARVQRVEFSASLIDIDHQSKTEFHGTRAEANLARTRVSSLGFVYPFPTYRGSMVIALGYNVPWILDREYSRAGTWGANSLTETIFEEGAVGEWSFGYAVDATPTLSLGVRASWIVGSRFQDWVFERNGDVSYKSHDVTDTDISGYTGSLGALARLGGWGRLGLVVDLPRWLHMEGTLSDLENSTGWVFSEKMTLPFSVGVGTAVSLQRLLLAADARFTDWTQIDYDGPMRYQDETGRRLAYQRTWDLHLGAEYLLDLSSATGLRLRAGYAREPVPYRILFEDITETIDPVYCGATFDPDRDFFTFGIGLLIAQSITVDGAFTTGSYRRECGDLVEEEKETRLLFSAAFRLE
jgi:long-subunit fatty acid transport protein